MATATHADGIRRELRKWSKAEREVVLGLGIVFLELEVDLALTIIIIARFQVVLTLVGRRGLRCPSIVLERDKTVISTTIQADSILW